MNKYSNEFKQEAVARSKIAGISNTCKELGVSKAALSRWRKEFSVGKLTKSKDRPSYEDLEKEVHKLKKELGYIEEINHVLKKSTAIFSSKELGGSK
ncbi:MAG: transposase [Bdellovibrionaceae bacterium]|nr:transposase [Pseudobdellovibrionaceae bacterium]